MHFREGRLKIRREGIRAARETLSPATETWKIIRLEYKSLFIVKSDFNLNLT